MTDSVYQMIARAQAEYARCIDDDRLEQWPDHFHGSCVYKITTAANHREGLEGAIIFANSKGMLRDRVSALREANIYERQSYRHILGQPSILHLKVDPEAITPMTTLTAIREKALAGK